MTVLVTGAGGFIGSRLVQLLVASGEDVAALVRRRGEAAGAIPSEARVVECDLHDETAVGALLGELRPTGLLHMAWYTRPEDYLASHENLASLAFSVRLAEKALATGCRRLLFAGSCLEYAEKAGPRHEEDPVGPVSLYGACKASAWLTIEALARQCPGSRLAWARIFHVHGPGEAPERLIPSVVRRLQAGAQVELSPGSQLRDQLHVDDVAAALAHLLQSDLTGPVNVCSGEPMTLREVLTTVAEAVGRPELLRFGARPYAPDEVMDLSGDPTRLRETGWRPLHEDPREALRAAVREAVA